MNTEHAAAERVMTSRERWDRHAVLDAERLALWAADAALGNKKRPPVYEREDYVQIVTEMRELHDAERNAALEAGWPVWQQRQHFVYLTTDGLLREGEVNRFDRDARTVTGAGWPYQDVIASLKVGELGHSVVTLEAIEQGYARLEAMEAESREAYRLEVARRPSKRQQPKARKRKTTDQADLFAEVAP